MAGRARVLGPEAQCHRVWGGDVGRCSTGPRELCECVLGGDGEPEAWGVACSRVSGLRGPLVVTQDAAVAACPRLGLCAGPALNRKRSPRPRSPVAARPGAHGPFGGDATGWSPGHASLMPSRKRRGGQARGPFRGRVPRLWRQEDLWGGVDTGPSAAGARAWQGWEVTFGALVTTGGLQGEAEGEAKHKAGSRSRRPQFPGAPVFPSDQLASSSRGSRSLIHTAGRECSQELCLRPGNPGPEDSEWIKPERLTLPRTGDVRLRACTASPGRRVPAPPHALPQRLCRGSSGAPRPLPPPFPTAVLC